MSNSDKLVTVIGGSGFIGRHVVKALAKRGYRVRVACLAHHEEVEIAGVGVTTDVAVGFVDRASIERVRRVNPALALRRFRVVPRSALPD